MHLKTGGMGKTIRIQYSVIQFFLNPYMDKGFENPKERDWLFCNVFLLLYYIYYILLVGGIKNRLKISVFYGEKVVHLADI